MGASGPDPNDPTTLPAPVPDMLERPDRSIERIEGVRIGFDERYAVRDVEAQVAAAVVAAVEMLEGLGAHLVEVRLPDVGETSYRLQRFTVPFDFNGAPTLTLPCGKSSEGLSLSLQLAGKPLGEPLLLAIAASPELISGYWSGKFDLVLQRFVDAIMTFPWLFLTLTIMSLLGPGVLQIILVLGFQWGIANVRTIRAVVLSTRENVYVEAARAVGCPTPKILVRHILPHMWAPIIVLFTVSLGANIVGEATVSFLGFGIPPPQPSWGTTLSVEGKKYMLKNPWLSLWPGLSLAVVVYGVNMLGDALRDLLDPRLRGGIGRIGAAN